MAASPNGVRSFHDGDGSDFGHAGPMGSQEIEEVFFRFFESNSLPAETTPFVDGDSDYEPFLRAGIPGGGLFTGEEKSKTKAQVQAYGGVAGKDLDPCYHEACDTISNTNAGPAQGNVRRPGLRHRILRPGPTRLTSSSRRTVTAPRRFGRLPEGAVR